MPPVGNDIVDLAAPGNPGKSLDSRFRGRVFTAEEQDMIARAAEPDTLLWALWAAKEAAYKAVSRRDPSICSIPRQYRVEISGDGALLNSKISRASSPLTGRVITPGGEVAIRIERTAEWVHALAAGSDEVLERVFLFVESPGGGDDPSAFVRKGLLREIARLLDFGCSVEDLLVVQDPGRRAAPSVLFRGCPLTKEVSLSHDGRFASFAFDPLALIFSDSLC